MGQLIVINPEAHVASLANQVDAELSVAAASSLLWSGGYARSYGLFPGIHYRKEWGTGCFHLRFNDGRAWLHWDRWDPRRYPIEHFFESPTLWVPAATAGALLLAARR